MSVIEARMQLRDIQLPECNLPAANYQSNLLPLTEQTRHLLFLPLLQRLPEGAAFINASRGAVVMEEDLLAAINRTAVNDQGSAPNLLTLNVNAKPSLWSEYPRSSHQIPHHGRARH